MRRSKRTDAKSFEKIIMIKFRKIKKEIRILAFDDGPFEFRGSGKAILIGSIFRGGEFMDGLLKTEVDVDGMDATKKIIDVTNKSKHKDLRVIMLDGITFAGFNTVDIKEIFEKTNLPVIVVNRKKPNLEKFLDSLKKLPNSQDRIKCRRILFCSCRKQKNIFPSMWIKSKGCSGNH